MQASTLQTGTKVIWGPTSDLARQWRKQRHDELYAGETDAILRALAVHEGSNDEAGSAVVYIEINRSRMRYPESHASGLCTSTGVVEAGCGFAIGVRLKRPGMLWTVRGANAIIALRCCSLSHRFED